MGTWGLDQAGQKYRLVGGNVISQSPGYSAPPPPGQCFAAGHHLSNGGGGRGMGGNRVQGLVFYIGILHLCGYWFPPQRVPSAFYLIMSLIFIPALWGFLSLYRRGAGFQGYQKSIDWSLSLAFLSKSLSVEILLSSTFVFWMVCLSQLLCFISSCS